MEPIEHKSMYEGGHKEWRPGYTCSECRGRKAEAAAKFPLAGSNRPPEAVATGTNSTNPKMEQFWSTGDPEVFSRP